MLVQVKPFRKLRKVHNQGKRTRLRDLIRYDLRQMHAAFTGTLPVGSSSEPLGHTRVRPYRHAMIAYPMHSRVPVCLSHGSHLIDLINPKPCMPQRIHLGQPGWIVTAIIVRACKKRFCMCVPHQLQRNAHDAALC